MLKKIKENPHIPIGNDVIANSGKKKSTNTVHQDRSIAKEDDEYSDAESDDVDVVSIASTNTTIPNISASISNEILDSILTNLKDIRFTDYADWFKLACIFKKERLDFTLFDKHSQRAKNKYNKEANAKIIAGIMDKDYNYTLGTLFYMLKQDNYEMFKKLSGHHYLWNLMATLNHADVAKYYYSLFPDKYIYCDLSGWYEYNNHNVLIKHKEKPISMIKDITDALRTEIDELKCNLIAPVYSVTNTKYDEEFDIEELDL